MADLDFWLQQNGLSYVVKRNGLTQLGLHNTEKNTGRKYIGFTPGTDIHPGDSLTNPVGETFYIVDVQTQFIHQEPYQLKAYYRTKFDEERYAQPSSPIFNIENAYGSVIGTQHTVTFNYKDSLQTAKMQIESSNSPDKEELQHIISLLEMIVNNQLPPQKGLLSKFSSVLERNSWITGSIASTLLGWLTSQI